MKVIKLKEQDIHRMVKRVLTEQSLKDKIKSTTQNIGKKVKQKINNRNIDWANIKSGELNNDNFQGYIKYLDKEGWGPNTMSMGTPATFIDNNPQDDPIYFAEGIGNIHSAALFQLKNQINQQGGAKSKPKYGLEIPHKLSGPHWAKRGMEGKSGIKIRQFYLKG